MLPARQHPTLAIGACMAATRRKRTVLEIAVWTFAIIEAALIGLVLWYR